VPDNDASPIADSEVHYLVSDHVGDEFKIFIGHCGESHARPPSVLYVSDANGLFASAVDIIRFMQLSAFIPPILVVGIGYRAGAIGDTLAVRTRDLTPTHHEAFARMFPERAAMGGADRFLAFIRDELRPWVEARFGVDGDDATFFGHSFGGLFATYALLTQPATFLRYGISSPSLWWHDHTMFAVEEQYAAAHHDLAANVFFAVGAHEDHEGRQREASRTSADERAITAAWVIDMVADTERMVASLRGRRYPSLSIGDVVLPGEYHVTVPQLSLSRALRFLYGAPG